MDKKKEETKHRTEWCAEANKYRCMRCGRDTKYMKNAKKMHRNEALVKKMETWRKRHFGGHDLLQAGASGRQEHGKMLKHIQILEDGKVPAKLEN